MTLQCPSCSKRLEVISRIRVLPYLRKIGSLGLGLILSVSALILFVVILIGAAKISEVIEPWISLLFSISCCFVIPACLLFSIFKTTRSAGGLGIFWSAKLLFVCQWMLSLTYCVSVGIGWAVVGLLFWGVGIIPMSCILMLFHRQWMALLFTVGTMAAYFFMTYISYLLIASGYR